MHYAFGRCQLDTESRVISLDGAPTRLSPKAFELLRLLVEDRPRVIPKAELMQRLWPDVCVEEANLPVLAAEVRAAIGDTSAGHIIKTHHRVGYGFAADVRESPSQRSRPQPGPQMVLLLPDGRRVALGAGINVVGRDRAADVRIDDPSVSRRHARIVLEGGQVALEDLESKNGTRVGGTPVSQTVSLTKGDVVICGGVETRLDILQFDDSATSPL